MLIRSQDKKVIAVLENCDSIGICKLQDIYHICTFNGVEESRTSIGKYSTEEKAIKVLDMIQEEYTRHLYSNGGAMATVDAYVQAFGFIPPKVFQMPQDSEV